MSRRSRDRQYKAPREKHTAKQRCERKKEMTKDEAKTMAWAHIRQGAAPWTCRPYRCDGHWHIGHQRGGSWSR